MKKLAIILLLVLLTIPFVKAQENALLWKIEHTSTEQLSYLFGTIHLMCSEDIAEHGGVNEALNRVDRIVFELDFSDPDLENKMVQASMSNGESINNYLSDREKEVLDDYFRKHVGAGLSQLSGLKPFALTSMAMQPMIQCSDQLFSYEGYLMQKALQQSLSTSGLETPEFQFGLFDTQPAQEQVDELVKGVMAPDSIRQVFDSLVTQYQEQDISGLLNTFIESSTGSFQKNILDNRNNAWIPKIESMMKGETIFIAVGAMHLAGENGVIELLRDKGYSVTPVPGN